MAAKAQSPRGLARLRTEAIRLGIAPTEGVEVFLRGLGCVDKQIVVSTYCLRRRIEAQLRMNALDLYNHVDRVQSQRGQKGREVLSNKYLAASNTLEERLVAVWEMVLGIKGIGVHDNFFELGGDSLAGLQLLDTISKEMDISLPLTVLFASPTVAAFSAQLRSPERDHFKPTALEFIVPLITAENGIPWFFVHPIGGGVSCYFDLARLLGTVQPVYGIKAAELVNLNGTKGLLNPSKETARSVEELAAEYIKGIQLVQPQGPYRLGGWSFGGVVAFEMACQLVAADQPVATVALLDSSLNTEEVKSTSDSLDYGSALDVAEAVGAKLTLSREEFEALSLVEQMDHLYEYMRQLYGLSEDAGVQLVTQLALCVKARHDSYLRYRPRKYNGHVFLIRAVGDAHSGEEILSRDPEYTNGWAFLTREPVQVFTVPGEHLTLIYPPYVGRVAECIQKTSKDRKEICRSAKLA